MFFCGISETYEEKPIFKGHPTEWQPIIALFYMGVIVDRAQLYGFSHTIKSLYDFYERNKDLDFDSDVSQYRKDAISKVLRRYGAFLFLPFKKIPSTLFGKTKNKGDLFRA